MMDDYYYLLGIPKYDIHFACDAAFRKLVDNCKVYDYSLTLNPKDDETRG